MEGLLSALLAGLVDVLFGGLGRMVWRVLQLHKVFANEFGDGGYQVLGLISFVFLVGVSFFAWGAFTLG
jgi:hypothetical protein